MKFEINFIMRRFRTASNVNNIFNNFQRIVESGLIDDDLNKFAIFCSERKKTDLDFQNR